MRYVTAREVAAACGVVPKTIRRWAAAGAIPAPVRGPDGQGRARWAVDALAPVLRAAGYVLPASWPEAPGAPEVTIHETSTLTREEAGAVKAFLSMGGGRAA